MHHAHVFTPALVAFSLLACASPRPAPAVSTSHGPSTAFPNPNAPRHMYRLDFTVSGGAAGETNGADGTYSMTLEEGRHGEIVSGANVPLSSAGTPRMDVGLKIKATYALVGDDLLLDSALEVSSGETSGIHKMSAVGQALVAPSKPAVVASIDDAQGKKRYALTVAVTKLR